MPYRSTPKTRARLDAARERIVEAASAQVAEAGYSSAGVTAVAKRAGVATGSVYRHFPSKADLFAEVFRRASQRELDVVKNVTSDESLPPSERVAAAAEAFAGLACEMGEEYVAANAPSSATAASTSRRPAR